MVYILSNWESHKIYPTPLFVILMQISNYSNYSTAERLAGVTAVLSNSRVESPDYATLNSFTLCGGEPGSPREVTLECAAGAIGRYLYLYLPSAGSVLTLCEVQIYGIEAAVPEPSK